MVVSINCLLLGKTSFHNTFAVNLVNDSDICGSLVNINNLKISDLKYLIYNEINHDIKFNYQDIDLWKVDITENEGNKLKHVTTEDDIKKKLGGKKLVPIHSVKKHFLEQLLVDENIHVIVQLPAAAVIIESFSMVMEKILENVARSSDRTPGFSSSIPLKERNMESAIKSISKNFKQSFYTPQTVAKQTLQFLVCCGAPGIGKTRYGLELFNHLKNNSEKVLVDLHSQPVPDPDFLSIYLDFGQDVELDCYDNNLTADSAIALRIAYKFFVVDESYQMQFNVFRQKIYDHFKVNSTIESLTKFESTINLNNVIQSIRMSRQLNDNRTLVILLHIDEIQIMFNYEKYWMRKGFTKRLLHRLALYMLDNKTFIQTFLSGTALQDVVKLKEPTSYNFSYINCPLLSMGACIEIVNYFAVRENDTNYQWTLDRSFIKILDDARGLPRAIEYILEEILERNLFKNHKNHPWNLTGFFIKIATSYNITTFVKEHKDLALTLLKNCLKSDSIERTHKVLKSDDNSLTYGELERDKHIILEDVDGKLFIAMPVYFIHLYNTTLNLADVILSEALISNQRSMEWQHWETFVAHFEMFKVNLLFASGKTTAKLNEIYPGAFGNEKTLSLKFKLKNLKGIAYLEHQFPSKYEGLRCRNTKVSHTWKDNIVFKNAASSEFGDSILRYVSEDGNGYFLCLQCKWIWGKDFQIPLKLPDVVGEHRKNLATLEKCDSEEIKKEKIITVLFTTRAIDPELTYDFGSAIPDNILLVCRDNFHQHFGRLFASRVDFELLSVNANYTCPDIPTKIFSTEIKDSPEALMLKRPFRSPEDFKDRVAFNDGVTFDSDEGIKAKICRLSYVPFQKRQVSQIQELPAFERRVCPRLANEERINYRNLG
ncbi:hypothetical protein RhiirB3_475297 [Rhizophagus irregularis]|nr:hypothetical protein RhiirB3_475297 [Rhizophagus irregularis]